VAPREIEHGCPCAERHQCSGRTARPHRRLGPGQRCAEGLRGIRRRQRARGLGGRGSGSAYLVDSPDFDALRGAQALERLVDDVSNWYVRRSRPRFWKAADPAAHTTLHEVLTTTALLLAPFCPFVSDEIHRNLVPGADSVHLADWPTADDDAIDPALEAEMARAREVVTLGRSARTEARCKVRQPLPRAFVLVPGAAWSPAVVAEIADELNVKEVVFSGDLAAFGQFVLRPNGRVLGPKLGKDVQTVIKAAKDGQWQALDDGTVSVAGHVLAAGEFDLALTAPDGAATAALRGNDAVVNLDVELTDELRAEGTARDLIRLVQQARKDADLAVTDRIRLTVQVPGPIRTAIESHRASVADAVLATELVLTDEAQAVTGTLEDQAVSFSLTVA